MSYREKMIGRMYHKAKSDYDAAKGSLTNGEHFALAFYILACVIFAAAITGCVVFDVTH